jgi:hypothetical protein
MDCSCMAFKRPLAADKGRWADDDPRERARQDDPGRREIGNAAPPSCARTRQAGLRASKVRTKRQSDSVRKGELFLCTMDLFAKAIRIRDTSQGNTRCVALRPRCTATLAFGGLYAG